MPVGGSRGGFYYEISISMTTTASTGLYNYLNNMNTFADFVQSAYILCSSTVALQTGGQTLLSHSPADSWPLDPAQSAANGSQTCLNSVIPLL